MASFMNSNPEYEYVLLDDDAAEQFLCQHVDAATILAYETLVPGAAKADILRIALLLQYGGVYFDTDCESLMPLHEFVWSNASVVTGLGAEGDFHQWALFYTPGHPFLQRALEAIVRSVRSASMQGIAQNVVQMTGPHAYHFEGVAVVLAEYNCSVTEQASKQLMTVQAPCPMLPDAVGTIEFFDSDYRGGRIKFKAHGVDQERQGAGHTSYQDIEKHSSILFHHVNKTCLHRPTDAL